MTRKNLVFMAEDTDTALDYDFIPPTEVLYLDTSGLVAFGYRDAALDYLKNRGNVTTTPLILEEMKRSIPRIPKFRVTSGTFDTAYKDIVELLEKEMQERPTPERIYREGFPLRSFVRSAKPLSDPDWELVEAAFNNRADTSLLSGDKALLQSYIELARHMGFSNCYACNSHTRTFTKTRTLS